jgi:hypothetical protein
MKKGILFLTAAVVIMGGLFAFADTAFAIETTCNNGSSNTNSNGCGTACKNLCKDINFYLSAEGKSECNSSAGSTKSGQI